MTIYEVWRRRLVSIIAVGMISALCAGCNNSSADADPISLMQPEGAAADLTDGDDVYVSASGLRTRSGPGADEAVTGKIGKGERVKVLRRAGEWIEVQRGTAKSWIAAQHVSKSRKQASSRRRPAIRKASRSFRHKAKKPRSFKVDTGSCPCRGGNVCVGPRGGRYCITSGGNKRYGV